MATEYEKKMAEKFARKVVRSAKNEWHKYGNVSIDDILKRKGFRQPWNSIYKYQQAIFNGGRFMITLDVYDLIIGHEDKITYTVEEY